MRKAAFVVLSIKEEAMFLREFLLSPYSLKYSLLPVNMCTVMLLKVGMLRYKENLG
jgi:hypothetical protein